MKFLALTIAVLPLCSSVMGAAVPDNKAEVSGPEISALIPSTPHSDGKSVQKRDTGCSGFCTGPYGGGGVCTWICYNDTKCCMLYGRGSCC